jgi:hypothetical protein
MLATCGIRRHATGIDDGRLEMLMLHAFWQWMIRSSDRTEKLAFRNQREAAEFVRRVYKEQGGPNAKLQDLYQRGRELKRSAAH